MIRWNRWWAATLVAALMWPLPGLAQAPDSAARRQQRQLDSLAAVVRALQARLDSLLRQRPAGDTGDAELALLRAAAAAAGAPADSTPATGGAQSAGNLNRLNPEISVTGDVRASLFRPGPQSSNFDPREYEFAFQSALDPYASAKVYIAVEGEEVGVEEGYLYFPALPGGLRLDLGRFRQTIGELNRWHLHAVGADDYPRVVREYAGDDGLVGSGASLYWQLPAPSGLGTFELTVQGTLADNPVLYAGGSRPAATLNLAGFWQTSRSTFVMASVTGAYGTNPDTGLTTRLGVLGARFTWLPPERARERELTVRGELWTVRRRFAGAGPTRQGLYGETSLRLSRRWVAGLRYDRVESPDPAVAGRARAVTPALTYWPSEFVYLRALWERGRDFAGPTTDRFTLRAVFAMGPHKHELF